MCHTSFLNDNSGAIQAVSSVILVGVTIVYAYLTKQMSSAVKRQQDLSEKPYIGMDRDIEMQVKLDTNNPKLPQVLRRIGFKDIPPYYDNPHALVFMEKEL